jgi:hypothetical protein
VERSPSIPESMDLASHVVSKFGVLLFAEKMFKLCITLLRIRIENKILKPRNYGTNGLIKTNLRNEKLAYNCI